MTDTGEPRWQAGWLRRPAESAATGPLLIKIGGSLLRNPGWPQTVHSLVRREAQGRKATWLVIGGGPVVDGLRQLDQIESQPAERMHRLAIAAIGLTAKLVAERLDLPLIDNPAAAAVAVLDVSRTAWRPVLAPLPRSWKVSSDSIAAVVAAALSAELFLVKSIRPPGDTLADLSKTGWLDGHFPAASRRVTAIRWAVPAKRSA